MGGRLEGWPLAPPQAAAILRDARKSGLLRMRAVGPLLSARSDWLHGIDLL